MGMTKILVAAQILLLPSLALSQQDSRAFSLSIRAESSHVESGNVIAIDIQIKNISNGPITCQRGPVSGSLDIAFQYDVRTADGHVIPRRKLDSHVGVASNAWPCLLQPGETAQSTAVVGRSYDMHLPGKYFIQISQKDSENGQVVKSNQVEVTVDPPEIHSNEQIRDPR